MKDFELKRRTGREGISSETLKFLEDRFDKYELHPQPDPSVFDLDDDEEVYFLQAPKAYDAKALLGQKINFGKRTKLPKGLEISMGRTSKGLPREVIVSDKDGRPALLSIHTQGHLVLRESTQEEDVNGEELDDFLAQFNMEYNAPVAMESNLKLRHPLLGPVTADTTAIKKERSPSKAKKRKRVEEAPSAETAAPQKKKKRKTSIGEAAAAGSDLQWLQDI